MFFSQLTRPYEYSSSKVSLLGKVLRETLPFPAHLSPLPSAYYTDCRSIKWDQEQECIQNMTPKAELLVSLLQSLRVVCHLSRRPPAIFCSRGFQGRVLQPPEMQRVCIEMWDKNGNSIQAHLILSHFADTVFFTNGRVVATLCRAGLLAPFFQQHLLASCLSVTFW